MKFTNRWVAPIRYVQRRTRSIQTSKRLRSFSVMARSADIPSAVGSSLITWSNRFRYQTREAFKVLSAQSSSPSGATINARIFARTSTAWVTTLGSSSPASISLLRISRACLTRCRNSAVAFFVAVKSLSKKNVTMARGAPIQMLIGSMSCRTGILDVGYET